MLQKLLVKGQRLLVLFNSTISCTLEQNRQRNLNSSSFQKKQKYYPWQRGKWCCVKTAHVRSKPKPKTLDGLGISVGLENSRFCLRSKVCHLLLFLMGLRSWAETVFQNGHCFSLFPRRTKPNLLLKRQMSHAVMNGEKHAVPLRTGGDRYSQNNHIWVVSAQVHNENNRMCPFKKAVNFILF